MKYYIQEMRIKHYVKNLLILLPLFFSGKILKVDLYTITNLLLAIVAFSFMSSVVYVINDIQDIESDRNHPTKKKRPIASGKIDKRNAIGFAFVLLAVSLLICIIVSKRINNYFLLLAIVIYLINNLLYSVVGLKNIPLLDVCLLTIGFLFRLIVGSICTGIECSSWLYLVVVFGSFFLGFGKRKGEQIKMKNLDTRKSLNNYSPSFLNSAVPVSMCLAIAFFALWCKEKQDIDGNILYLILVPIMMLGCLKYMSDLDQEEYDGDPVTTIFKDKTLLVLIGLAVIIFIIALY